MVVDGKMLVTNWTQMIAQKVVMESVHISDLIDLILVKGLAQHQHIRVAVVDAAHVIVPVCLRGRQIRCADLRPRWPICLRIMSSMVSYYNLILLHEKGRGKLILRRA